MVVRLKNISLWCLYIHYIAYNPSIRNKILQNYPRLLLLRSHHKCCSAWQYQTRKRLPWPPLKRESFNGVGTSQVPSPSITIQHGTTFGKRRRVTGKNGLTLAQMDWKIFHRDSDISTQQRHVKGAGQLHSNTPGHMRLMTLMMLNIQRDPDI